VVCHGIPSPGKILKKGDIVNIDVAVIQDGWFGDTSRMYVVGTPSPLARRLVDTTYEAMRAGIRQVKPGATLGDIGHAIQAVAQREHFSVVREYCGHGIGQAYHEAPDVLNYGLRGEGLRGRHGVHHRAHAQCRRARNPAAARRMDGGDEGQILVRPMGAHGGGDAAGV
jgi:methionyl aminopeptidase